MARILIVDDEINIIRVLSDILQDEDHIVYSAGTGQEAISFISKNKVDLVFLDLWLPDIDGLEVLDRIKKQTEDIPVVMISGHGSIDIAVKSTKQGAYDFLEKPLSMERIITVAGNALESYRLRKENQKLRRDAGFDDEMIGMSPAIADVKAIIAKAASTNARVFITGENGTGKELVARAIYARSSRSDKPFIQVNCAAIPDELIESELFGHEKGSFTGAVSRRIGKFELADGGTLFLDEICDMSASAQAKVLRVLQEQRFERVGGNETLSVDVRVIAATNIDVRAAIENNQFREDLYYRLNVIPIHVPPLRDRTEDIPLLVDYYLQQFVREHGVGAKELSADGIALLKRYVWPGNVRELKNIMERVVIMVQGDVITADDLEKYLDFDGPDADLTGEAGDLRLARAEFEKKYIIEALTQTKGNVSLAAKKLGIERTNLHRKLKQYNINPDSLS